jgi:hypothetical protein
MSNEKGSLSEEDEALGMSVEEFVREKLLANLKPTTAKNRVAKPTTRITLRATAPAFLPAWYPPAEYTNSFEPKDTGSSSERESRRQ